MDVNTSKNLCLPFLYTNISFLKRKILMFEGRTQSNYDVAEYSFPAVKTPHITEKKNWWSKTKGNILLQAILCFTFNSFWHSMTFWRKTCKSCKHRGNSHFNHAPAWGTQTFLGFFIYALDDNNDNGDHHSASQNDCGYSCTSLEHQNSHLCKVIFF